MQGKKNISFIFLVASLVLAFSRAGYCEPETGHLSPLNPAFLEYVKNRSLQSYSDAHGPLPALMPSPIAPEIHKPREPRGRRAMSGASGLPTKDDLKYDMRDPNGDGNQTDSLLTPVRDQKQHLACWVFGIYGSLESNIKKSFGIDEDLSENNLLYGHGFDSLPANNGETYVTAAYLSRYDGPINETYDPCCSPDYRTDCSPERYIDNVLVLPVRSGFNDNNYIKEAILEYGGIFTSMLFEFKNSTNNPEDYTYNREACTYYCSKGKADGPADNHIVTIVGWDDTIVVENAPGIGAFIVRNSWGTTGYWAGDGGYLYVSYYDKRIAFSMLACFDEKDDADLNFDRVLYYDKFGLTSRYGYGTDVAWGVNRFDPDEDGWLTAVGFFATHSNLSYNICIFEKFKIKGPSFIGQPRCIQSGLAPFSGWYTVKLDQEVAVRKNEGFGVAIQFNTPDYIYPVPIESPVTNYCPQATANAGESYVSGNGFFWDDLTETRDNEHANVCIKALWKQASEPFDVFGDINDSKTLDLTDAIIGLQICSGITPASIVDLDADVNGDGKIGMEEVIYVLRQVSR